MIHPTINELTNNGQINRYTLVVATAKCARIITDEYVMQRELAEKVALSKESDKKNTIVSMIKREYRDEKAVKNAITGLYSGEFRIVDENEKAEADSSADEADVDAVEEACEGEALEETKEPDESAEEAEENTADGEESEADGE